MADPTLRQRWRAALRGLAGSAILRSKERRRGRMDLLVEDLENRLTPSVVSYTGGAYAQNFDTMPTAGKKMM